MTLTEVCTAGLKVGSIDDQSPYLLLVDLEVSNKFIQRLVFLLFIELHPKPHQHLASQFQLFLKLCIQNLYISTQTGECMDSHDSIH